MGAIDKPRKPRNTRGWTDDDLRAAVAAEHSWRGVARALGLRHTSTNNLRRHVARLQLDTSHFSGKRPWSDHDLRAAVGAAATWEEALGRLNITVSSLAKVRVKGHAIRLGLDVSHLDILPPRPRVDVALTAPRPELLRRAAPALATAWFALRGHATVTAAEEQEYDLVVSLPEGFRRIQVKSSTCRAPNGRWNVGVARRPYALDKSASHAPYDPEALDYFFIVTGDGGLYLAPSEVLAGRTAVYIDSYPEYRIGDASSLLTWDDG